MASVLLMFLMCIDETTLAKSYFLCVLLSMVRDTDTSYHNAGRLRSLFEGKLFV